MLFNIEYDSGEIIVGYAVVDGVAGSLDLVVVSGGEEIYRFLADEPRPALVQAGRHENGECGFRLSTADIPGLAELTDLEILERSTQLLLYRRPQPHYTPKKVLRLETSMLPLWRFDNAMRPHFQYWSNNIETFGKETTTQFFMLTGISSVYVSGSIFYKNYAYAIEAGFECIAILRDPFEELAERIYVTQNLRYYGLAHFSERDLNRLTPAIEYFDGVQFNDERGLRDLFRLMPDRVASIFSNPLTRQLTSSQPGEMPAKNATAVSLDILSYFSILGVRDEKEQFIDACHEHFGLAQSNEVYIRHFTRVAELAEKLRAIRYPGYLLENDREIYQHVTSAFKKAVNR